MPMRSEADDTGSVDLARDDERYDTPSDTEPGPKNEVRHTQRLRVLRQADLLIPAIAILFVSVFVAFGISGSSLPLLSSDSTIDSSLIAGTPRPIRSDEYIAWSPIKIGQAEAGFPDTRVFGMGTIDTSDTWRHHVPSASVGQLLYSPFNSPLVLLPVRQGFAGYWWGPFLAAFLGCYAWFRTLGARWAIAAPSAILVVVAPAASWWSGWQLQGLAHATAACALVIIATRQFSKHRALSICLAVGAAIVAAGLPWFYQPWAIVAALFVASLTLLWGLGSRDHRRAFLWTAAIAGTVFAAESLAYLLHERAYYEALADTLYPGARRFSGGGLGLGFLFSSYFAATVNGIDGGRLTGTNLSEFSSGWTPLLLLAVGIAIAGRRAIRRDSERVLIVGALVISLCMASWAVVDWGPIGRLLPLTLVAPERLAPFIGFFGLTCLVLLAGPLPRWQEIRRETDREASVIVGVLAVGATLWAVSDGRRLFLPSTTGGTIAVIVLIVSVLIALLLSGRAAAALWATATIGIVTAAFVNPLTSGVGAIETSPAAQSIKRLDSTIADPVAGTWAADDLFLVPLLNGTGVDSLSSFNDPVDPDGWRRLDPGGVFEPQWNRFAYIVFRWESGLPAPIIESPQPDVVVVRTDPCDPALDSLRLQLIVSTTPLDASCLDLRTQFQWEGVERSVYSRGTTE